MAGVCDGEMKVGRVFTNYDTTNYRSCQYIKWVLVFGGWAQKATAISWRKWKNTVYSFGGQPIDCVKLSSWRRNNVPLDAILISDGGDCVS